MKLIASVPFVVVWIRFDEKTLDLGPFLFFGWEAAKPLPSLGGFNVARHTRGDRAARPDHRVVVTAQFEVLLTVEAVFNRLFVLTPEQEVATRASVG